MTPVCAPWRSMLTGMFGENQFSNFVYEFGLDVEDAIYLSFAAPGNFVFAPLWVPVFLARRFIGRLTEIEWRKAPNVSRFVLETAPATDRLPLLSMGTEEAVWGRDPMLDEQFSWDMSSINLGGEEYGWKEEERQRK